MLRFLAVLMVVLLAPGAQASGTDQPTTFDFALELPALRGGMVDLSDYKGQVVVLNFWASWCFPCRYEMPHLQKVHDRYKDRGLTVIAVAIDDQLEPARAFQDKYAFTFPMLFDQEGISKRILRVEGVPETYIIDRSGELVPIMDSTTNKASRCTNDPTVWEGEQIDQVLSELLSN